MKRTMLLATVLASITLLAGCGALHTSIAKRDLDVQTKMSASIFLDPVEPELRTVYVDVRNTSDKPEFDLRPDVVAFLTARGYQVIDSPKRANYWLQANVLQVGKTDARNANAAMAAGPGVAGGAVTGYALHRASGGSGGANAAGAIVVGAVAGTVIDAMVKDIYYSVITDIQVMERLPDGIVKEDSEHKLRQGTSGDTVSTYQRETDQRKYQTRVMSYANQVNLEWEEAAPSLRAGLARAIAGMF